MIIVHVKFPTTGHRLRLYKISSVKHFIRDNDFFFALGNRHIRLVMKCKEQLETHRYWLV